MHKFRVKGLDLGPRVYLLLPFIGDVWHVVGGTDLNNHIFSQNL